MFKFWEVVKDIEFCPWSLKSWRTCSRRRRRISPLAASPHRWAGGCRPRSLGCGRPASRRREEAGCRWPDTPEQCRVPRAPWRHPVNTRHLFTHNLSAEIIRHQDKSELGITLLRMSLSKYSFNNLSVIRCSILHHCVSYELFRVVTQDWWPTKYSSRVERGIFLTGVL